MTDVDWGKFDFIDFGSGTGGSLASAEKRTGSRGIGVELRESKVRRAREEGKNVVQGDIFNVAGTDAVEFVTIDNVLEHLPTMRHVEAALQSARNVARDFIYIRHPSFEDECYLNALGLKQFWTDWTDHPAHIQLSEFMRFAHALGASGWLMHPVLGTRTSDDPTILPLEAPSDQQHYDRERHGEKESRPFNRTVYYAWDIVIVLNPAVTVEINYLQDPENDFRRPRLLRRRSA